MDIEKRVDKLDEKLDELKDYCRDEFYSLGMALVRLESATADRNKLFGKGTVKMLAAVIVAVLSALGITAAANVGNTPVECIDAGIDSGDTE